MKEYKLISLDEYDSYLKWKNGNVANLHSKTTEDENQDIGQPKDNIEDDNNDNRKKITSNISNKNMDTVIENMDTVIENNSELSKGDSDSMELLPPPGIPLNNDKQKNITYKQNGKRSEWIQYWRKSIR